MSTSLLPQHLQAHLYDSGHWRLPGDDTSVCRGAKFHSPTPLFVKSTNLATDFYWRNEAGVADSSQAWWAIGPQADLCGTCRDNLWILQQMLKAADGPDNLAWPLRREFGNALRALALEGWRYYTEHRA